MDLDPQIIPGEYKRHSNLRIRKLRPAKLLQNTEIAHIKLRQPTQF